MVEIYTDGATEGHNGKLGTVKFCGIGYCCPELGVEFSDRVKGISNNEAEFLALIAAMEWGRRRGIKSVRFLLDSQIVVNRANGRRPKKKYYNSRMDNFQNKVLELASSFDEVEFKWIPRDSNWQADYLSKLKLEA